ncbi:MAG: hypothetical protein ACYDIC_12295 [Desulfobaccales bacterium]
MSRPKAATAAEGSRPSQSRAARAGVARSSSPWGVRDRARKSFSREKGRAAATGVAFRDLPPGEMAEQAARS